MAETASHRKIKGGRGHRLEPRNRFKRTQVLRVLEDVIREGVEQIYYSPEECAQLCRQLAAQIRLKVKAFNYDRCKLVCVVEIVQKKLQGALSKSSFLWNPQTDNYAIYKYEKFDLIAVASVFGVYYD